jgi:heterodisulfide reductase subunit A
MIQCVGSRAEPRGYCSRVCCAGALRQALRLRSESPDSRVLILHRDIMAVGAWERTYSEARRAGVMFVPYDEAHKPTVRMEDGRPVVALHELVLGRELQVQADCLVLATGLVPDDTSADVARVFGLGLNQDGFYREANAKWRPIQSERDGIFLAGAGHCPQPARDVLAQAEACAQRAFALLSRGDVVTPGITAEVHHALCARCEACVTACPYHARHMDAVERRIVVDPMSCRACGGCAVACASGAARVCGMGDRQLMAMLDAVLADVTVGGCNADGELR